MCGIIGYIATSKHRPDAESFKKALKACSARGTDATGFFTVETGVVKKDLKATEFIDQFDAQINEAVKSNMLIGHCRATTKGTHKNNVNNHPHESDNFILVHNGSIRNSDEVTDYKFRSECDSENILAYVEKYGVSKGLQEMYEGDGQSIALYDKKLKKIWLFRNSNPAVILLDKKEKIIYFGSTYDIVNPFYRYSSFLGFSTWDNMTAFETSKNKLYLISPEKGMEKAEELKQKTYVYKADRVTRRSESSAYQGALAGGAGYGSGYSDYQNRSSHVTPQMSIWGGNKSGNVWCESCQQVKPNDHVCKNMIGVSSIGKKSSKRTIFYNGGRVNYLTEIPEGSQIVL